MAKPSITQPSPASGPSEASPPRPGNDVSVPRPPSDPPLAELVKQLSEQTSRLARQEVELAKAELGAKGKQAGIELGETVAALAQKAEVKAQARSKLQQTRATVSARTDQALTRHARPRPTAPARPPLGCRRGPKRIRFRSRRWAPSPSGSSLVGWPSARETSE